MDFELETARDEDAIVLWLRGDVDLRARDRVASTAIDLLADEKVVIADLSGVTFLDSSGLSALVQARKAAIRLGRRFAVRSASPPAARVLTVTGLATWLDGADRP
jgi:anti-sigma B factor antagonist